jgi:hypothetical protein
MNTIATQERIPKQVVLPATDVVGLVQNTKVLRVCFGSVYQRASLRSSKIAEAA